MDVNRQKERVKTMDKEPKATSPARRVFLKTAGLGAGAAAAGVRARWRSMRSRRPPRRPRSADGYRETAHVKRFYELGKKF